MLPKPIYLTKEERSILAAQKKESQSSIYISKNRDEGQIKSVEISRERDTTERPRKARKVGDRKLFFDWDTQDDTSIQSNNLENELGSVPIMFGRGRLGGLDPKGEGKIGTKSLLENNRHWSEKSLETMQDRDWRIFREDFNITTKGGTIPNPMRSWDECQPQLPEVLKSLLTAKYGYQEPTPIQRQAIPIALNQRDLIGIAKTGSGKTIAFLIPILAFLDSISKSDIKKNDPALYGPFALILAPTRELAQQIGREATKFTEPMGLRSICLVGGHSISEQAFELGKGAEIVIATPGRLKDCLEQHMIVLQQCRYLVLDEADRMLDMGFEPDLAFIKSKLPIDSLSDNNIGMLSNRQTLMFSATMPPSVEKLARIWLLKPITVTIGTAGQVVDTVSQIIEWIPLSSSPSSTLLEEKKRSNLLNILSKGFEPPIIIFTNMIDTSESVYKFLNAKGFKVTLLHGRKVQEQREAALSQLKQGTKELLVATDVASRGLDVPDVSLVINYDMAKTIEDYVHRIGRTGRAGKSGAAITFLSLDDENLFYDLKQQLSKSTKSQYPPELFHHPAAKMHHLPFKKEF
jgi:ATP-dependent RNA helicase DDX23/PRP28